MLKFNKCFPQTVFPVASFSRFLRSSVLVVQFFDALPRGVEVVAKICSWQVGSSFFAHQLGKFLRHISCIYFAPSAKSFFPTRRVVLTVLFTLLIEPTELVAR